MATPECNANCSIPTDIVLVSSDGAPFGTHSKNLGEFTGGFPLGILPNGEEIAMPDMDSKALSLFLQYVHHHRQPDLTNERFSTLAQLAEAVEKYEVYSATEICKAHMLNAFFFINILTFILLIFCALSLSAKDYPFDVFIYAVMNDYPKLMNEAAKSLVKSRYLSQEVKNRLSNRPEHQAAWIRYKEQWRNIFTDCFDDPSLVYHPGGIKTCAKWQKLRNAVVPRAQEMAKDDVYKASSSFDNMVNKEIFRLKDCRHCLIRVDKWVGKVTQDLPMLDSLVFTSFL